jgi:hypothetical protein
MGPAEKGHLLPIMADHKFVSYFEKPTFRQTVTCVPISMARSLGIAK